VSEGSSDPARRVLALAEEERQLVGEGRVEELDELHARREVAMGQLPEILSEEARGTLTHALALQRQIGVALRDALAVTGGELGRVTHGRTAARGYTPAMDARRTLDQTA
jgi:hypothetical protein